MSKKLNLISQIKNNYWGAIVILLGSLTWSLTMVKSGMPSQYGYGFWGPNGHDGIWHIALAESLARGSFAMPIFSGAILQNYHVGFDLILAMFHKLTLIPIRILYFQILPPLIALGTGIFTYLFVYEWKDSRVAATWATFFLYFGGSWGWLVTLIRSGSLGGESMFWSQQSISTLINPPFALSLLLIFSGLWMMLRGVRENNSTYLAAATFLFGILIQIKVYAGLLVLGGLMLAGIYEMIMGSRRENVETLYEDMSLRSLAQMVLRCFGMKIDFTGFRIMKVFSGALIISLLLFLPVNASAGSTIVFKPFWFLETLMQLSDRLDWPKFGEAMVNYRLGNIWWKAIPAYFVAFFVFWYGNMGTRLLNELYFAKRLLVKKIDYIDIFFFSIILVGGVIPMFFLQKGTPWNTIQFFYYSLIFSGVISGIVFGEYTEGIKSKKLLYTSLVLFVIAVTIPTTYATLVHNYLPSRPPAKLSQSEIDGLGFLESKPMGIVLTYPFDQVLAREAVDNPPRPLYLYESSAYISAFGKKDVYLEDEVNLNITGYDWPARREKVEIFLDTLDQEYARSFLIDNNIRYIYWVGGQRATLGETQLGIEKVYENDEVDIYEVRY